MEILVSILIGVLSSLVASLVIFFMLFGLRPKLVISPYIAWEDRDGAISYWIKVVNHTRHSSVVNIRCRLYLVELEQIEGGVDRIYTRLPVEPEEEFALARFNESDRGAEYEMKIMCKEPLHNLLSNVNYLLFEILGEHAISHWGGHFLQEFRGKSVALREGAHKFGRSLDVGQHERLG